MTLRRSSLTIWIVSFYSALSIFSWVIIVYLAFYPITNSRLRYRRSLAASDSFIVTYDEADRLYAENEQWVQTARVLLSFAGVLSIPVASATCAGAAPVYSQRRANSRDLSLRKVVMLADKCWTNPLTYLHALVPTEGYRRYGSPFLLAAIGIHLRAFLVSPLQQVFLGQTTVKRAGYIQTINELFDVPGQFASDSLYTFKTNNTVVLATRASLSGVSLFEPQVQLWSRGEGVCSAYDVKCSPNIATLSNLSALHDPFLAELPSGYNTGLIRQFLPRINSSAKIVPADFPRHCGMTAGSLFYHHSSPDSSNTSLSDNSPWAVTVCMPTDVSQSVRKPTRDRQDFSEELYVNVTFRQYEEARIEYTMKITVDTTAGYFELPNNFNGGKPGPLLAKQSECGLNCRPQFSSN